MDHGWTRKSFVPSSFRKLEGQEPEIKTMESEERFETRSPLGKNKNKGIKDITNTSDDESLPLPCQTSQTALVTGTASRAISRWALKVRQLPGYLIQARKRFQVNYKTLPYEHQACRPEALVDPLTNRGRPHETSSQGLPIFQQDQESSAGDTIASEWNT
ncbi:hypothetical protein H9L39_18619 [Fusarium oxysporum f. sp. albedinis]|nr:hypothetical protein H9L39_18619 [Fusarium oxysporum f. sp. albedinis]